MPSLLVFSVNDIGKNYRLLRHAKSFSLLNNSHVTILAPEISSIPKEIEKAKNINIHHLYVFHLPFLFNYIAFPIQYILIQFQCFYFYMRSLIMFDFIISSPWPLLDSIFSLSLSRMFKAKLIFDISSFKYADKTRPLIIRNMEKKVNRIANYRICSTRSLQIFLQIQKLTSSIIHDPPRTQFYSNSDVKKEVFSFLNISERYLIAVLMPNYNVDFTNVVLTNCTKLNQHEVRAAFIFFGNPKIQNELESFINNQFSFPHDLKKSNDSSFISNYNLKYLSLHFVPLNTDAYTNILRCCDLGILSKGSRYGFDYSPELTDLISCGIPIIIKKGGCISEVIENGKNGFIISTNDQLFAMLSDIFVDKKVNLISMKEEMKKHVSNWDLEWKNAFDPIFEDMKFKRD